jgi:hypothetical protein
MPSFDSFDHKFIVVIWSVIKLVWVFLTFGIELELVFDNWLTFVDADPLGLAADDRLIIAVVVLGGDWLGGWLGVVIGDLLALVVGDTLDEEVWLLFALGAAIQLSVAIVEELDDEVGDCDVLAVRDLLGVGDRFILQEGF